MQNRAIYFSVYAYHGIQDLIDFYALMTGMKSRAHECTWGPVTIFYENAAIDLQCFYTSSVGIFLYVDCWFLESQFNLTWIPKYSNSTMGLQQQQSRDAFMMYVPMHFYSDSCPY